MENVKQIIAKNEMHSFMCRCMESIGTNKSHAKTLADCLLLADYRGHFSHGLNRLKIYVKDIQAGVCKKDGTPTIIKESAATALIDGNNLLGPVVGTFAMELAIKKAKECGIGWVSVRGSNHFGIAGFYGLMACEQQLIGMAFTNASPLLATSNGRQPFFGTNPLCVAAPGKKEDFVLDMATSVVAFGKVEMQDRKGEPMPNCWAVDSSGHPTTDPKQFCALMPLGGGIETSIASMIFEKYINLLIYKGGYKGFGLSMMVEIFCSVLSGAACAPHVRNWQSTAEVANLGQCFVAIDPSFFEPNFPDRMTALISDVKNQEPAEGAKEVLVAGDPERRHMEKCDKLGGIPYHCNQIKFAEEVAGLLGVAPPSVIGTTSE